MLFLEVNNLSKSYNRRPVFSDVSFTFTEGVLGIAGHNGSGKSTLLKCLTHLSRPNSGSVRWSLSGSELSAGDCKSHFGFVAPYINLYAELTAIENLEFLLQLTRNERYVDAISPESMLEEVQMKGFGHQLFKQLSTGQQQRIKLAAALIKQPDVLILDEPGSNLDDKGHALVKTIIDRQQSSGKLTIIASNDPNEIALSTHRIHL